MTQLHDALKAAQEALYDLGDDENADELESAIAMFAPYKGDSAQEARKRTVKNCRCGNCDLEWPAMAMPAPLMDVALAGQRLAKCPRCFATENIFIGG